MLENSKEILQSYKTKSSAYWQRVEQYHALQTFKEAVKTVPAYRTFLKSNKIKAQAIRDYRDFLVLPYINKKNYFHVYEHEELVKNNFFETESLVMTSTSGSTGQPTYFPRTSAIDWQYSVLAEFFLNNGPKGSTLVVNCFGMGVWVGGVITYQAFRDAGLRGYPVTIISPGINKKEIFHSLRELAPHFKNVIVAGYPPFIKDILDEATIEKINFSKFHTRLLFAAESFTESFRDHVAAITHIKNVHADTLNIYGSAEMGAMAFETPGSILIRRLALKNRKVFEALFPQKSTPTLAQYNPAFVSFEAQDKTILITANNAVPFVRYKIGDTGGIFSLEQITSIFKDHGINLAKEAAKKKAPLLSLPFVYVHVRDDFSTKLYGAIIHPQHIQEALQKNAFKNITTGKFTMATKATKHHDQYLEINIELRKNITASEKIKKSLQHAIMESLLQKNAEYKNNFHSIPEKVKPVITLWDHESTEYFKPGIKQNWVIKN